MSITQREHRLIMSCLHPDRVSDPEQKKRYAEAFNAFTRCFPDRGALRDGPPATVVPRDRGEPRGRAARTGARTRTVYYEEVQPKKRSPWSGGVARVRITTPP
jgi:hypothetical protein